MVTLYITVTLQFLKGDRCTPGWLYISVSLYRAQSLNIHYLFIIIEWYWKVWLCPWLLRITAVLLFLLSVTLVWSEVTFFNKEPVLSIFALMIDGASVGYYYFYVEVCETNMYKIGILFMCSLIWFLSLEEQLWSGDLNGSDYRTGDQKSRKNFFSSFWCAQHFKVSFRIQIWGRSKN